MYTLYLHFLGGNVFNTNKFYMTLCKFFAENRILYGYGLIHVYSNKPLNIECV